MMVAKLMPFYKAPGTSDQEYCTGLKAALD
jgi:hypothetical protein